MADRAGENSGWRKWLRRERHSDGESVDYISDQQAASERQRRPQIDLNNPANKTRVTRQGTIEPDQPIRGGREKPLPPAPGTENYIP